MRAGKQMGRVTKVVEHLRVEEIKARIRQCTEPWRMRLLASHVRPP